MTRTEKAWQPITKEWILYGQTAQNGSEAELRLRETLRRLQSMRLPVDAIELIGDVATQAYQAALENSWCDECGLRADGMTTCSRCKQPVHNTDIDSVTDVCLSCQDAIEDEDIDAAEDDDL